VVASLAELDASLTSSAWALLPVFATLEARERPGALFVGTRFAWTDVLEHDLRVAVAVVLAHHACDILTSWTPATTKHQYAVLDGFLPRANEATTYFGVEVRYTVVTYFGALDIVLTVYAFVGWSVVLDLLILVVCDVIRREDVTELAWVKRFCPLRRVVVLELEGLVEHFPYARNADGVAVDLDAGVVAEALATAVACPYGSHCDVVKSGELWQEVGMAV
jgi:hypothetical protein